MWPWDMGESSVHNFKLELELYGFTGYLAFEIHLQGGNNKILNSAALWEMKHPVTKNEDNPDSAAWRLTIIY